MDRTNEEYEKIISYFTNHKNFKSQLASAYMPEDVSLFILDQIYTKISTSKTITAVKTELRQLEIIICNQNSGMKEKTYNRLFDIIENCFNKGKDGKGNWISVENNLLKLFHSNIFSRGNDNIFFQNHKIHDFMQSKILAIKDSNRIFDIFQSFYIINNHNNSNYHSNYNFMQKMLILYYEKIIPMHALEQHKLEYILKILAKDCQDEKILQELSNLNDKTITASLLINTTLPTKLIEPLYDRMIKSDDKPEEIVHLFIMQQKLSTELATKIYNHFFHEKLSFNSHLPNHNFTFFVCNQNIDKTLIDRAFNELIVYLKSITITKKILNDQYNFHRNFRLNSISNISTSTLHLIHNFIESIDNKTFSYEYEKRECLQKIKLNPIYNQYASLILESINES